MGTVRSRSGDRVCLELAIQISGTDGEGRRFVEDAKTLVLSRNGAKIHSRRALTPQQEVKIRCLRTRLESTVRVIGEIGGGAEGYHYGVEILDPGVNLWGIDFPRLTESEMAPGRVLLECTRCSNQEVVYLEVFAVEVLLAHQCLWRPCQRCKDTSMWRGVALREGQEALVPGGLSAERIASVPPRIKNERRHPRVLVRAAVCIRHPQYGEEVVANENVSRTGFRFKSRKHYPVGTVIEAAIPYADHAANIFAPARIVYVQELPGEGKNAYGVSYIAAEAAEAPAGMRATPTS